MNIKELQREAHRIAVEHGFWEESQNFGEKIALCHSELSEALEAARHNDRLQIAEEFADVIIRIADLAEYHLLDLDEAIHKKMAYNETRPRLHGKKF